MDLIVCKCHNDSSHITKQYFAANGDILNSQITKLLHELHFTNTLFFLYIYAFKMLLTRSSVMSNFAVTTLREHWSKTPEKLSPSLSVACTQHRSLSFCILRVDTEKPVHLSQ